MYCVWTYHVESQNGEKKWVNQFEAYRLATEGWKITASSHETCFDGKELDSITSIFLNKESLNTSNLDSGIYLSSATKNQNL